MIVSFNQLDAKSIKIAERQKAQLENAGYFLKGTKINTVTEDVTLTYAIKGTTYEHWREGRISNFGGFHTLLLKSYMEASEDNRRRLAIAFPEWFVEESEM